MNIHTLCEITSLNGSLKTARSQMVLVQEFLDALKECTRSPGSINLHSAIQDMSIEISRFRGHIDRSLKQIDAIEPARVLDIAEGLDALLPSLKHVELAWRIVCAHDDAPSLLGVVRGRYYNESELSSQLAYCLGECKEVLEKALVRFENAPLGQAGYDYDYENDPYGLYDDIPF